MSGTQIGGNKAAIKNRRLDPDFYKNIGRKGGKISRGGGFGSNMVGPDGLTGKERAVVAGIKGGQASTRGPAKPKTLSQETTLYERIKTRFKL